MRYLLYARKRHRVENYIELIECWTEQEFKENLRLSRQTALKLIDEFETSEFMPSNLYGMRPISGKLSIYIFLWFMANTEPLRTISDRFDISISSVFRIVRRVMTWILTKLDEMIDGRNRIFQQCAQGFF